MAAQLDWIAACDGVPSEDFLEGLHLPGDSDEAVTNFCFALEQGVFVMWEGVLRLEQGLPLSKTEKKAVQSLCSFSYDEERTLYIDALPRPRAPWHETLKTIAEALMLDKVNTVKCPEEVFTEGWDNLLEALENHGVDLRLPPGVTSCVEVVPAPIRWHLDLQSCLGILCGIGQPELTLTDPEERRWRLGEFFRDLVDHADSVRALHLTLPGLLERLRMPGCEKAVLRRALRKKMDLQSPEDRLADRLKARKSRRQNAPSLL